MSYGLLDMLRQYHVGDKARVLALDELDDINRSFFNQLLGEGEVSIQCNGNLNALIQESLLAGVWRVQYVDEQQRVIRDTIEVADIPGLVSELTFADAADNIDLDSLSIPESVYNAPPLLTEVSDKLAEYHPGAEPHIINLSLLPHTRKTCCSSLTPWESAPSLYFRAVTAIAVSAAQAPATSGGYSISILRKP